MAHTTKKGARVVGRPSGAKRPARTGKPAAKVVKRDNPHAAAKKATPTRGRGLSVAALKMRSEVPATHPHLATPTPTQGDLDAVIADLRERLRVLYSGMMLGYMQKQPPAVRQRFADGRDDLQHEVDRLEQAQLDAIANELKANDVELKAGISNLKRESEKLQSAAKIVGYIADVVAIVARIAAIL